MLTERPPMCHDAGYLESFEEKPRCERCGSEISGSVSSDVEGIVTLVCKGGHDFDVPEASNVGYRLVDERVLDDVCC